MYKNQSVNLINSFIAKEITFDVKELIYNKDNYSNLFMKVNNFMELSDLVEFKIWAQDLTVVYSYLDKNLIGRKFPDNDDLIETITSKKPKVDTEHVRKRENEYLSTFGLLIEMYVPVFFNGKLCGIVEVYRKTTPITFWGVHTIAIVIISLLVPVLIYLFLFGRFKGVVKEIIDYQNILKSTYSELTLAYFNTIRSLAKALELRDMETEGHSERVVALSLRIGQSLSLSDEVTIELIIGAYLHDIGKIGVPDSVLLKPGRLTPEERKIIETHVIKGYELVSDVKVLSLAADVILNHHEKWDGTGYPHGKAGLEIPITARIFAIVDVFDALMSKRPYKEPIPYEKTLEIINSDKGKHFDPEVVDVFNNISYEEIVSIFQDVKDNKINKTITYATKKLICRNRLAC
ncbi:MAG: HD domain-containing protein [Nitrospirae bacterium YQR-1]